MIYGMVTKILKFVKSKFLYSKKVIFTVKVLIGNNSSFEGGNKINNNTYFNGRMGFGSYIGFNSVICGSIGRFTSIGSNCITVNGTHPYTFPFVATSPVFYSINKQAGFTYAKKQYFNEFKYADENKKYDIIVGNDCWIGTNVTMISGIEIGDGAVVLTNSVVTKNIPPYAIVGGVPAKIIKYRYDSKTIEYLLKIKWWEKDIDWIKKNSEEFNNFENFKMLFSKID